VKLVLKKAIGLVFQDNDSLKIDKIVFGFPKNGEQTKNLINNILPMFFEAQTLKVIGSHFLLLCVFQLISNTICFSGLKRS
jgi:hypothetical protein